MSFCEIKMNQIVVVGQEVNTGPQPGDIYELRLNSHYGSVHYCILSQVLANQYNFVSLQDGNRFRYHEPTIAALLNACDRLGYTIKRIGRVGKCKITIEAVNDWVI
jgi:hypothetical protein